MNYRVRFKTNDLAEVVDKEGKTVAGAVVRGFNQPSRPVHNANGTVWEVTGAVRATIEVSGQRYYDVPVV